MFFFLFKFCSLKFNDLSSLVEKNNKFAIFKAWVIENRRERKYAKNKNHHHLINGNVNRWEELDKYIWWWESLVWKVVGSSEFRFAHKCVESKLRARARGCIKSRTIYGNGTNVYKICNWMLFSFVKHSVLLWEKNGIWYIYFL